MEKALDEMNEKRLLKLGEQIVKYQKFNTKAMLEKIDTNFLSDSTAKVYFNAGISYIKAGTKYRAVPSLLFQAIDKAKENCIQPLRPAQGEERRETNRVYTRKSAILPVNKVVEKIVEDKAKYISKFEYGIKIDNKIMIFTSKKEAEHFIDCMMYLTEAGKAELVTVDYDVVKE